MAVALGKSYVEFIDDLKNQIKIARVKAHLAVNRELVLLYFRIGKAILEKQRKEKWGSRIIEQVSKDLKSEFPNMTGLSRANMFYMRKFSEIYENEIVQQAVGQFINLPLFNIPWGHNVILMDQISSNDQRFWYANDEQLKKSQDQNTIGIILCT